MQLAKVYLACIACSALRHAALLFLLGQVTRISRRLVDCKFERLYGAFAQPVINAGAALQVQQSLRKYRGLLDGSIDIAEAAAIS